MKNKKDSPFLPLGITVLAGLTIIGGITTIKYCYEKTSSVYTWTSEALIYGRESKEQIKLTQESAKAMVANLNDELLTKKVELGFKISVLEMEVDRLKMALEKKADKVNPFQWHNFMTNIVITNSAIITNYYGR